MPLATTPGGRVFALKALHPSDHEIKSARLPGGNALSVSLCSDQVYTIPLTGANSDVQITVAPHPIVPASVVTTVGGVTTNYNFVNAAFGGSVMTNATLTSISPVVKNFNESVERYRITSQSATVELIAPSLSDQGTITAAQYSAPPKTTSLTVISGAPGDPPANVYFAGMPDYLVYERPVVASQLVLGTSAYTSKAREGVYMPLKLNNFKWRSVNDSAYFTTASANEELGQSYQVLRKLSDAVAFPLYVLGYTDAQAIDCMPLPKCCGDNFGLIAVLGTAANVAIRVRVRQVVEITCKPSTRYAPLVEAPLPPDEMALKMYFEISGRMADGYPASYNDLGKLRDLISRIAKGVAPFVDPALTLLSGVPGPVGLIASGAKTALPSVRNAVSLYKSGKQLARLRRERQALTSPQKK